MPDLCIYQQSSKHHEFPVQNFFRTVCHQVLNEMQEARMLIAANPYTVDIAAICDLLAAEPDKVTHPMTEPQEPFGSHALPGEQT